MMSVMVSYPVKVHSESIRIATTTLHFSHLLTLALQRYSRRHFVLVLPHVSERLKVPAFIMCFR